MPALINLLITLIAVVLPAHLAMASDATPVSNQKDNHPLMIQDTIKGSITGPEMLYISGGTFLMGDATNAGAEDEKPVHQVHIQPFYLSKYEITQALWKAFSKNSSDFKGSDRPVENVSLKRIHFFIKNLNRRTGRNYRLPTEAEWEYAARAGSSTNYSWGNEVGKNRANCRGCGSKWDGRETAPVGSFKANAFGLHDMHGNVWEWVQDCHHDNYNHAPDDGSQWKVTCGCQCKDGCSCFKYMLRGGSWSSVPADIRSANRFWFNEREGLNIYGFRLALSP